MASFMTSLWESIFTPGPTSTLILATNLAFGALQVVLLSLLIATRSIHFVVLSLLCAGLWFAINWFTTELASAKAAEAKAAEEEETKQEKGTRSGSGSGRRRERQKSPESVGSETETEKEAGQATGLSRPEAAQRVVERKKIIPNPTHRPTVRPDSVTKVEESEGEGTSSTSGLLQSDAAKGMSDTRLGRRRKSLGESSTDVSTDSEWEKVSEGEATK